MQINLYEVIFIEIDLKIYLRKVSIHGLVS